MKKLFTIITLLIFCITIAAGCSSSTTSGKNVTIENGNDSNSEVTDNETTNSEKISEQTVQFTDSIGRTVEIPSKIEKIAPSAGLSQMVLMTIAPDMLVGFASTPSDEQLQYFENVNKDLPTYGQFHGDNFNLESLVKEAPDVIIDIGERKADIGETLDQIQQKTGIPTIFIESTLESIPDMYKTLGELLDREEQTNMLAQFGEKTLEKAEEIRNQVTDENRVSLYYGSREKGLHTNAKGSFHLEILDYVGIENVAELDGPMRGGGTEISMEQLMLWDPEIIILDDKNIYEQVISGKEKSWQELTAVKNGEVYLIPSEPYNWIGFPPSVNRMMGMNWLGSLVYPDLYEWDIKEVMKEYYSTFYQYDLTDDEMNDLMEHATREY